MRQQSWKTWFLILLSLTCFAASVMVVPKVYQQRKSLNLEVADLFEKQEAASELKLPLAALFIFRSLAIDYLWIRADKLKNDGQFFDALHLARMICELQPHLAKVWDFQAWNMAYNISVAMPTPPERWNWVYAGYTLLRDKGLLYNPRDPVIYDSLAWIFRHKIGGIADDYNRYYKLRFAFEIMPLLGEQTNEEFAALAEAPMEWEAMKDDPEIQKLADALKAANPDFKSEQDIFRGWLEFKIRPNNFPPDMHQVIANIKDTKAYNRLDCFIRAQGLRREWKLDINKMIAVNQKYGPIDFETDKHLSLDWRLPWSHAIYWGLEGLQYAKGKDFNETRLHRTVYQSLQDLYHFGHCQIFTTLPPEAVSRGAKGQEVFEKGMEPQIQIFNSQDLRMFPIAYRATLDIIDQYVDAETRLSQGVIYGSINMACSGIVNLYLTGHRRQAQKYLNDLKNRYPNNKLFLNPLEDFVRGQIREEIEEITPKNASNYINGMLRLSYSYYALRDDNNASIYEKRAEQVLDLFWKDYPDEAGRLGLLDFPQMRWLALRNFIADPQVDFNIKGYLLRRMKTESPDKYERVISELQKENLIPKQGPATQP